MEEIYEAEIKEQQGIEIRAGMQIVDFAACLHKEYKQKIRFNLRAGENIVNALSIMELTMLTLTYKSKVEVIATTDPDSGIHRSDLADTAKKLAKQIERDDFKKRFY